MREKHGCSLIVLATVLGVAACSGSDVGEGSGAPQGTSTGSSDVASGAPKQPVTPAPRPLVVTNEDGSTSVIHVVDVDGRMLFEGDIEVPQATSTRSASVSGKRWPGRNVAYVIDDALPLKSRVTDAIAHWEAHTSMRFVKRTNESDYVRFTPGRGCSSPMGRVGSAQDVVLQAGVHITTMIGADFSPTTSRAYFWFQNGVRSVGRSSNIDEYETLTDYALPAGRAYGDVIDMAIAGNGDVYTFYRDSTYSIGTPANLGSIQTSQPFALPPGKGLTAWDVIGVAFSTDGHLHAWYDNGTTSEGTAQQLGATVASQTFTLPTGQSVSDVLALGIAGSNVYAWYWGGKASGGIATSPGSTWPPYEVKTPGHCGVPQTIHEIGHAVGLWHEQTRLDRDQYITINWTNIHSANVYNFNLRTNGADHGTYDYTSIMHYDSYAFSSNGAPTMTKKDGSFISDPDVLSSGDIAGVAWMYP